MITLFRWTTGIVEQRSAAGYSSRRTAGPQAAQNPIGGGRVALSGDFKDAPVDWSTPMICEALRAAGVRRSPRIQAEIRLGGPRPSRTCRASAPARSA